MGSGERETGGRFGHGSSGKEAGHHGRVKGDCVCVCVSRGIRGEAFGQYTRVRVLPSHQLFDFFSHTGLAQVSACRLLGQAATDSQPAAVNRHERNTSFADATQRHGRESGTTDRAPLVVTVGTEGRAISGAGRGRTARGKQAVTSS